MFSQVVCLPLCPSTGRGKGYGYRLRQRVVRSRYSKCSLCFGFQFCFRVFCTSVRIHFGPLTLEILFSFADSIDSPYKLMLQKCTLAKQLKSVYDE